MTRLEKIGRLAKGSKIRLVATDMDGTLLNPEGKVTDEVLDAMLALSEGGVKILLCSGRTQGMMTQFCAALPVLPVAVPCNGGIVYDFARKKVVEAKEIKKSTVASAIEFALENSFDFMAYSDLGEVFYLEGSKRISYLEEQNESLGRDGLDKIPLIPIGADKSAVCEKRICKMLLTSCEKDAPKDLPRFWEFANRFPDLNAAKSASFLLDIMARGATKGSGLKFVADSLSIPLSQVLAVGDNQNDVSMFERAGISACLANGEESAKAAARFVTERTCGEGGWIEAVERGLEMARARLD